MKRILFFIGFILLTWAYGQAQNRAESLVMDSTSKHPKITFVSTNYDFGKIRKGEKVSTSFYFKNTGSQPLVLLQVQTSCGCTATSWSREPILPNQTGEIAVTFDSLAQGHTLGKQKKVLLVISNATNKEENLTLTGEVFQAGN